MSAVIGSVLGAVVGSAVGWTLVISAQNTHNSCYVDPPLPQRNDPGIPLDRNALELSRIKERERCYTEHPILSWFTGWKTGTPAEVVMGAVAATGAVAGALAGNAIRKKSR